MNNPQYCFYCRKDTPTVGGDCPLCNLSKTNIKHYAKDIISERMPEKVQEFTIPRNMLIELDNICALSRICKNPLNDPDYVESIGKLNKYLKTKKEEMNIGVE